MKTLSLMGALIILITSPIVLNAQLSSGSQRTGDEKVASKFMMSIGIYFGMRPEWSSKHPIDPKHLKAKMESLSKSFEKFSDTEKGKNYKKEAQKLVDFIIQTVEVIESPAKFDDDERVEILNSLGLEQTNPSRSKAYSKILERVDEFEKLKKEENDTKEGNK